MGFPVQPDEALPRLTRTLTQEGVNRYAEATGDFNPIHVDPEFAARSPFGKTIAHGMLVLAHVSQMMALAYSSHWASSGRLRVRFKSPAFVGDTVTIAGRVKGSREQGDSMQVECMVECLNQRGEVVLTGDAAVALPRQSAV